MLEMVSSSDLGGGAEAAPEKDMSVPWYEQGACRGMDVALFFPGRGEKIPDEVEEACRSCVVRKECEAAGLEEFGIWGGRSERARRRVRRVGVRRRRAEEKGHADADPLPRNDPSAAGPGTPQPHSSTAA